MISLRIFNQWPFIPAISSIIVFITQKSSPRFPPIQFQKESPREKRKSMESGNGARADAPSLRGAGRRRDTTRAERTIWERATTRSARAKSVALRLEIGSSGAVYSHTYRNKVVFALAFFAPHQRKPVRFGRAARFARVEGEVQKFKSRRFSGGRILGRSAFYMCVCPARPCARTFATAKLPSPFARR